LQKAALFSQFFGKQGAFRFTDKRRQSSLDKISATFFARRRRERERRRERGF
jgi:hypothetical protein